MANFFGTGVLEYQSVGASTEGGGDDARGGPSWIVAHQPPFFIDTNYYGCEKK